MGKRGVYRVCVCRYRIMCVTKKADLFCPSPAPRTTLLTARARRCPQSSPWRTWSQTASPWTRSTSQCPCHRGPPQRPGGKRGGRGCQQHAVMAPGRQPCVRARIQQAVFRTRGQLYTKRPNKHRQRTMCLPSSQEVTATVCVGRVGRKGRGAGGLFFCWRQQLP